jgi:hypothetical protein
MGSMGKDLTGRPPVPEFWPWQQRQQSAVRRPLLMSSPKINVGWIFRNVDRNSYGGYGEGSDWKTTCSSILTWRDGATPISDATSEEESTSRWYHAVGVVTLSRCPTDHGRKDLNVFALLGQEHLPSTIPVPLLVQRRRRTVLDADIPTALRTVPEFQLLRSVDIIRFSRKLLRILHWDPWAAGSAFWRLAEIPKENIKNIKEDINV